MMVRNNVTRMLAARKVPFNVHVLPAEKVSAIEAALLLGIPAEHVFKTIVVTRTGRGKPILALVPAPDQVDPKALARAVGEKKVRLTTEREAERLTGLQAGGISPLALLHKRFQVIVDSSARDHKEIYLSGGQRGLDISLSPEALLALTNGSYAAIKKPMP